MKKFLPILISILILAVNNFSQDFSGIKICLNPGHGGFDSNDRHIIETGFWESVGNLDKGLALRNILTEMNADIVMTRTTNTTADDLPLSQIVAIANANNVDFFHSIHSNGFNGLRNSTLVLFQGFDNSPTYPAAKTMGSYVVDEIYRAHRTTGKSNRGDFDFYGTGRAYLGVFKGLNMPGTLSEGSFHDYIPESWRLRNKAYTKHEAWAIEKGFASYFHVSKNAYGEIAGIVRDQSAKVPYFYITTTNDAKKPINNIKVTLLPNNIVYNGDDLNNGFFLFDSLAPGQYNLVYEAEGYFSDSSTVTVQPNMTVFADKYLRFDTSLAPIVLSALPLNNPDSIDIKSQIEILFSREMDTTSTKNAFSISPAVSGKLLWEESNSKLRFIPDSLMKATTYNVTVSASAKSIWNVNLDNDYLFSFATKNRDRLNVLKSYPPKNQNDISTTVQFRLYFDNQVENSTLGGRIKLYDDLNNELPIKNPKIFSEHGLGIIYFEPKDPLQFGSEYKIILSAGIEDTSGYILFNDVTINFNTEANNNFVTKVIDDFENLDNWSFLQNGTDTNLTLFNLSFYRRLSGTRSGKLSYNFTTDTSNLSISRNYNINEQLTDSTEFGIWVFGDNSNNILSINLSGETLPPLPKLTDTLNWTGWKFKHIPLAGIVHSGGKLNSSIKFIKNIGGSDSGELYFDDVSLTSLLTSAKEKVNKIPSTYSLSQNYPNPFNPSTVISWQTPVAGKQTIKVYNILGNEVATLIDEYKPAGTYEVEFNASSGSKNLASGVYFYQLKSANFIQTKKMILMK